MKLPMVEAQTHRRFLKTHLLVDALVFSPKAKYLHIGRDALELPSTPQDGERQRVRPARQHARLDRPPIERTDLDVVSYFRQWLAAPSGGTLWEGGAGTFINKGTNGRWRDVLAAKDVKLTKNAR